MSFLSTINLQSLVTFLHLHPHSIGFIAFGVVFLEALAVVGVIVPGSVTMTALGILVGSNVIPAGPTFGWAIVGAILGDIVSYWFGFHYKNRLHRVWPFNKHPHLLERSEKFFKKHGGKSVFLGRFIGPMRAMVPMVAGMFSMPTSTFLLAALPSASLWAIGYIMPGVLLGALSLELPPKVATQFILFVFIAIVAIWAIAWLIHHFAKGIYVWYDKYVMRSWLFMQRHKTLCWLTKLLADPREPNNHQQLSLVLLTCTGVIAFFITWINVATHGALTFLNNPIYHLLLSLRVELVDHVMVALTLLGEDVVLISAGTLFLLWLAYKRYWYVALHWFAILLLSAGAILAIKQVFFFPRPGGINNFQHTSSFPSGHTMLSLAIFGFWATIVAREITARERRWLPYAGCGILVTLIALSRLYLGAHWLTDVAGSFFLGMVLVLVLTISYRRSHITPHFSLKHFIMFSILALLTTVIGYGIRAYPQKLHNYSLQSRQQTITSKEWQKEIGNAIRLYRFNRLGKPIQAFNIEWVGSLDKIEKTLLELGWQKQPTQLSLHDIILNLAGDNTVSHLPLFPQLYHNRPMVLLMTKQTEQDHTAIVLRLWQSDITMDLRGLKFPLWLGVVDYHYANHNLFKISYSKSTAKNSINSRSTNNSSIKDNFEALKEAQYEIKNNNITEKKHHKFIGATETLHNYMKYFKWQMVIIPKAKQPTEMHGLNWDGVIFLITPRNIASAPKDSNKKSKNLKSKTR